MSTTKRQLMCAYGNCTETIVAGEGFKLTVTVSINGTQHDRQTFCCYEHAWRSLRSTDERLNGRRQG